MGEATVPGIVDCASQCIHAPGAIQPHGQLYIFDIVGRLLSRSRNIPNASLGLAASDLLPKAVADAVGQAVASRDREATTIWAPASQVPPHGADARVYRVGETVLCEMEPRPRHERLLPKETALVEATILELRHSNDLHSAGECLTRAIRQLTGFERVLILRFDTAGHGFVVTEDQVPGMGGGFHGFQFPAGDIPAQARALYVRVTERYCPMREAIPISLEPSVHPVTGAPFDLSDARCRALAATHTMYNANLGVDGSMSLSIMDGETLWGMVIGHHRKPHRVKAPVRPLLGLLTSVFAMRLNITETRAEHLSQQRHAEIHSRMLEQLAGKVDFVRSLLGGPVALNDLFHETMAAAIVVSSIDGTNEVTLSGPVMADEHTVEGIADYIRQHMQDGIWATECLGEEMPDLARLAPSCAGVLAIAVGEDDRHLILWFRAEHRVTEVWAGATPTALEERRRQGDYLPRKSFERWETLRKGRSRPWYAWKLALAQQLRTAINHVILRNMNAIAAVNQRLEAASVARDKFLAHMSHEMRTPMNGIIGFAEALQYGVAGAITPQQTEYVDAVLTSAHSLQRLLDNLFLYSQMLADQIKLRRAPVDLGLFMAELVDEYTPLMREQGVRFQATCNQIESAFVVDREMLKLMVGHLLSNALRFTHRGGEIVLSASTAPHGGGLLTVADNGKGMTESELALACQPFRHSADVKVAHQGCGLGLPIVHGLMTLHGGSISISSQFGHGSTVTLCFPDDQHQECAIS